MSLRIVSTKYVNGAKGQPCSFRMPGICDGGGETTVFAHIRDSHTGRSIKASDISGADACYHCHAKFDGQSGAPLSEAEWLFYALRGIQETLENRIRRGLLIVPLDAFTPSHDRPVKPRKPPAQRSKIASRKTDWPTRSIPKRAKPGAAP